MSTKRKLDKLQREILTGILLGDACLQTENRGKTYRLRISQSEKHKHYLFHLYDIFKEFVSSEPKKYIFTDQRNPNKFYTRWSFATIHHACFRFYAHQFYENHQKKVPKLIHRWLTPRSIAYWYMDDGAQKWRGKSKGVRFCTDNFTSKDVKRLRDVLQQQYGLQATLQKQRQSIRIYIRSSSFFDLKKLIFSFIHESMLYKFPQETPTQ